MILRIQGKLLYQSLVKVKKYIGNKTENLSIRLHNNSLVFTQYSETSAAEVVLLSGFQHKGKFSCVVPYEWIASFTATMKTNDHFITISANESEVTLKGDNKWTKTAIPDEHIDRFPEFSVTTKREVNFNIFGKTSKQLLTLKSLFTDRPCAATIGHNKKYSSFIVNDQYHMVLCAVESNNKNSDILTTSAEAFKPMLETEDDIQCFMDSGRIMIETERERFMLPIFDPAAAPRIEDFNILLKKITRDYVKVDAGELKNALDILNYKEDPSQVFTLEVNPKGFAGIRMQYSSSTVAADATVASSKVRPGAFSKPISVDPRLFSDTLSKFSGTVKLFVNYDINVLAIQQIENRILRRGFVVLSEDS